MTAIILLIVNMKYETESYISITVLSLKSETFSYIVCLCLPSRFGRLHCQYPVGPYQLDVVGWCM